MNSTTLLRSVAAFLFASQDLSAQAQAPVAGNSDRAVYQAAFYAPFSPRTALDMVNQTPGFVLSAEDEGDDQRRGFSGAVGNVLIDGERLSAKSQSLSDVLSRIPASEVLRIEILRGSQVSGDASGASVLANVLRTPAAGGGTWMVGTEVTNERKPMPTGRFGWSGRDGTTEYSIGGNTLSHDHQSPSRREVVDGSGVLIANRSGHLPHQQSESALNGQYSRRVGDGKLVATGQIFHSRHHEKFSLLTTTPAGAQVENEFAPYIETHRTGEAGVTYQRAVSGWDMTLAALATRKHVGSDVRSTHFDAADVQDSVFAQALRQRSGESIVRASLVRDAWRGRLEVGGEVAVNTLDGELDLTVDDGTGPVVVDVPNANLSVEENRAEFFASHAMPLGELWSLDSRLAVETSQLTFTGDTEQSVSLTYLKPRVQVTRKFGPHQLQMRVFRDVGQLDFTDFVSTAALVDDQINGGNPDLRPQVAWAAEIEGDMRFPGDAALRVRLYKHFLDDVVDLIPVGPPGDQIDAPGNIGSGSIVGSEISLRVPLAKLLPGGTFSLSGTVDDTEVHDPVTGARRPISDFIERQIRAELRQDLNASKVAWGVSLQWFSPESDYRLNEIDRFRDLRQVDAFVETTAIAGVQIRLTVQNALGDGELRDRRFYSPDRNGLLTSHETGQFYPEHWWLLTVSGDF